MAIEAKEWVKPSGTVKIKLIVKSVNPAIQDPEHEAYNLFGTSTRDYLVPVDEQNNLHNHDLIRFMRNLFYEKLKFFIFYFLLFLSLKLNNYQIRLGIALGQKVFMVCHAVIIHA